MQLRHRISEDSLFAFLGAGLLFTLQNIANLIFGYFYLPQHTGQALPTLLVGLAIGALVTRGLRLRATPTHYLCALLVVLMALALGHFYSTNLWLITLGFTLAFAVLGAFLVHLLTYAEDTLAVYSADLLGSAVGLVLSFYLIQQVGLEMVYLALCTGLASLILMKLTRFKFVLSVMATVLLCLVVVQAVTDNFNLIRTAAKIHRTVSGPFKDRDGQWALRSGRFELLGTRWDPASRVDALRDLASGTVKLYYNNRHFSMVTPHTLRRSMISELGPIRSALVVGVGGGAHDLHELIDLGVKDLTAVELNRGTADLMLGPLNEASQQLYSKVGVQVREGRSFLEQSQRRFDFISLNWTDVHTTLGPSGIYLEDYLYTKDAFESYLEHLEEGGMLYVVRGYSESQRLNSEMLRILSTLEQVYRERGGSLAASTLLMKVGKPQWNAESNRHEFVGFFKKGAFTAAQLARVDKFLAANARYDLVYIPGRSSSPEPLQGLVHRLVEGKATRAEFDHQPATDNHPFFMRHPAALWSSSYFRPLLVTFGVVLLLIAWGLRARRSSSGGRATWAVGICALSGLIFGFIEMAILQGFVIYISRPHIVFITVLTSLFVGGALGSWWSGKTSPTRAAILYAAFPVYVMIVFLAKHRGWLQLNGDFLRTLVLALLILPAGFIGTLPFATAMRGVHRLSDLQPLALSSNYLFLSVGLVGMMDIALAYGFFTGLLVACGLSVLLVPAMFFFATGPHRE